MVKSAHQEEHKSHAVANQQNDSSQGTMSLSGPTAQRQCMDCEEEMQAPSQMKLSNAQQPFQMKDNTTGMPDEVKGKMESSFGTDFSDVKVHTNSASATDVGALAYTQGSDVHFAPGQFKPDSTSGQELIGHELTHVVQQREGRVQANTAVNGLPVNNDAKLEGEADAMGKKAAQMKSEEDELEE